MSPEPLDYRSPGERPIRLKCPGCGSDLTVAGWLEVTGALGFRPRKLRKLFHMSGVVKVDAVACTKCGAVSMCVDRDKLVDLAGDPEVSDPTAT